MESGEIGVQPSMLQVEGLKLGNYVIEQSLLFRCHTGIWKVNVNVDVMLVIPWMMELCIQTSHKFDVMHASWFMINQSYSKSTVLISCDLIHWLPYHWDMIEVWFHGNYQACVVSAWIVWCNYIVNSNLMAWPNSPYMPPKHTRKVQLGINCTYLVLLPLIFGNSVCIGADVSQLIVLFHFVMFRMEWSRGKAVEFILKILNSKLDGISSIF